MNEQNEQRQTNLVREACSSPLFLALSIIVSVATLISFYNVFYILLTIGMWLAFASAKSKDAKMKGNGLKLLSGTAKAIRIVALVIAIIIIVFSIISLIVVSFVGPDLAHEIDSGVISVDSIAGIVSDYYEEYFDEKLPSDVYEALQEYESLLSGSDISVGTLLCIVLIFLSISGVFFGAFYLVLSLTFFRFLHKFIRSVFLYNENNGGTIEKSKAVKGWLIVMGILSAIGSFALVFSNPLYLAEPAMLIVAYIWVGKYFS